VKPCAVQLETMGMQARLDFGTGRIELFVAGGLRRLVTTDPSTIAGQVVAVNGEVEIADGTRFYAVLEIDESSSGEHVGTLLFTPEGLLDPHEPGALKQLGKDSAQVFPYRYRPSVPLACADHHTGNDGWSR